MTCNNRLAGEHPGFDIDYVATRNGHREPMDVVRFLNKDLDREPMIAMPFMLEMMCPCSTDEERAAAVRRLIYALCPDRRFLREDLLEERWFISLANDKDSCPKTLLISVREACAVLAADGGGWAEQRRAISKPMQPMEASAVADRLGALCYYSKLYLGDEDVPLPPGSAASETFFEEVYIKSVGEEEGAW